MLRGILAKEHRKRKYQEDLPVQMTQTSGTYDEHGRFDVVHNVWHRFEELTLNTERNSGLHT